MLEQVRVGQLGDRRPDVADRAGPNPPVDPVQLGVASLGEIRVGRAHLDHQPGGLVGEPDAADFVPSDHETVPRGQVETLKLGESADQPRVADPLPLQGDQADDRGGGDAAPCPDSQMPMRAFAIRSLCWSICRSKASRRTKVAGPARLYGKKSARTADVCGEEMSSGGENFTLGRSQVSTRPIVSELGAACQHNRYRPVPAEKTSRPAAFSRLDVPSPNVRPAWG